jgi:hypothetical protein
MATLHVELDVRDYDLWREAFGRDAGGRQGAGVRRYRIFRPVDDDKHVVVDLDFDSAQEADGFLTILKNDVWSSREKAPSKLGTPQARIFEMVEDLEYS